MRASEFSAKIKLEAWERCRGRCEECLTRIAARPEYDHKLPLALGGASDLLNCQVLCQKCHRIKTSTGDVPRIAKAKRQQRKAIGAWPKSTRPLRSRGFSKRPLIQDTEV